MKTFEKSKKLDNVLYDVRGPVVDEAANMEANGEKILKLNIGNPAVFGFSAPQELLDIVAENVAGSQAYSESRGKLEIRQAILEYANEKNFINASLSDIYTGNGASELIQLSLHALLNDGDEILIPAPDYPLWTACVNLAGGKAVHYICDEESNWYPDVKDIESKITDKTKAIVVINPNNPTGSLYPKEVLEQIVDLARKYELIIFADEMYDRLVMDGKEHIALASLTDDVPCVSFGGLSKSHMICGFRAGWMILSGNKEKARDYFEGINMLSNMRLCSNVIAQAAIPFALKDRESTMQHLVPGGRVYEQRNLAVKMLNDIPGVSCVKPDAAFYAFPKLDIEKFGIKDDVQFALDFLKEKKVLVVQGTGFNWNKPDHFRVVYLPEEKVLKEAIEKLGDFLGSYRQ